MGTFWFVFLTHYLLLRSVVVSDTLPRQAHSGNEHPKCHHLAIRGDCNKNVTMWSECHHSCLYHAKDYTTVDCKKEAEKGHCFTHKEVMQLECPESCSFALAWFSNIRQAMHLSDHPPMPRDAATESCIKPRGILDVADIMRNRLLLYIAGGAEIVEGLSMSKPEVKSLLIIKCLTNFDLIE